MPPCPDPAPGAAASAPASAAAIRALGPVAEVAPALHRRDYPDAAYERRISGTVFLRFVVDPTGRVSECTVTRSSGSRELDATTCRLILRRFRYRPARDAQGNPIASVVRGEHQWEVGPEPPPIDVEPDIPDPEA